MQKVMAPVNDKKWYVIYTRSRAEKNLLRQFSIL